MTLSVVASNYALLPEISNWPLPMIDAWNERAAILEFDAGMTREAAERAAYWLVKRTPIGQFRQRPLL